MSGTLITLLCILIIMQIFVLFLPKEAQGLIQGLPSTDFREFSEIFLCTSVISCLSPRPPSHSGPQATARYTYPTSTPLIPALMASFHFQTILLPKDIQFNNRKKRGKVRGKGRLYGWKDEKAQKEKVWGILKHRSG